ncbi:unnamed protein product, partial [Closterium sp. Naga37s-1]
MAEKNMEVSSFVLKAGTRHGLWKVLSVEGNSLVCRAFSCISGMLGGAEGRYYTFQLQEVVPAVVRDGRLLGPPPRLVNVEWGGELVAVGLTHFPKPKSGLLRFPQ